MLAFKEKENKQLLCWYYIKKLIIHPEFFDDNNIFSNLFIQNLKHKPNMVQYLSRKMKISLKKQRLENSFKHKIHQILCITSKNGKTEYRGRTYAKNEVVIEPGWISNDFELREPEFYKLVTTVTCDDDSPNIYTVPVVRCNKLTSVNESKYEEKRHNSLICTGESI